MLEVKIPSPSVATLKEYIAEKGLTTEIIVDRYMTLLANSVYNISGSYLRYGHEGLSQDGMMATVNLTRLQSYSSTAEQFSHVGFEQAMMTRIAQAHKHYGSECPIADAKSLQSHLCHWHPRWVTIYLWLILSVDRLAKDAKGHACLMEDKNLMAALMAELDCFSGATRSQVMDREAFELAGAAIDNKFVKAIVIKTMNQMEDLACRSQVLSFEDRIREKTEIQDEAYTKFMRVLGGIMHLAKTDDDYFGADAQNHDAGDSTFGEPL